jgi:hypothetical protein
MYKLPIGDDGQFFNIGSYVSSAKTMNAHGQIATLRLLYAHCKPMRDYLVKNRHKHMWEKQHDGVANDYDLPQLSWKKTTKTTTKKRKAATTKTTKSSKIKKNAIMT